MQVSTILDHKSSVVATIRTDATVAEAAGELNRFGIGALVVADDGQHIDGILSERDIVRALDARGAAVLDEPVAAIMSERVRTCSRSDEVESLMSVMTERRIRHLPVTDQGVLVGIVSIGDIVKSRIGELERNRDELVEYINAR
jgi:CBS domain-containing protein